MMDDSKIDDQSGEQLLPADDKFVRTLRRMLNSPPSPAEKKEGPRRAPKSADDGGSDRV